MSRRHLCTAAMVSLVAAALAVPAVALSDQGDPPRQPNDSDPTLVVAGPISGVQGAGTLDTAGPATPSPLPAGANPDLRLADGKVDVQALGLAEMDGG